MKQRLRNDIERALGRRMKTPKDFEYLRENIYLRNNVLVSPTTLKRFWRYLDNDVETRESTLSILARFLGYVDWDDYCCCSLYPNEQQSSPIMSRRLNVAEQLQEGCMLRLTWHPDRICDVEYIGNLTFRVLASTNTRLQVGDTFQCCLIVDGEPLYVDNLVQGGRPPVVYVCGKKSGVRFEIVASF